MESLNNFQNNSLGSSLSKSIFNSFLRYFVVLIFLSVISSCFFACKSDSPVTIIKETTPDAVYNYASHGIPYDSVRIISFTSDKALFYKCEAGFIKFQSIPTNISNTDTAFIAQHLIPLSKDYYVYTGRKASDENIPMIKIYDNGVYTNYSLPPAATYGVQLYILEKNKFFIAVPPENKYYIFQNGAFTEFNLKNASPTYFGKANGNYYLIALSTSNEYLFYRVTDSGPVYLRTEGFESGSNAIYPLNNDLIQVRRNNGTNTFAYFTEQGWSDIYTLQSTVFDQIECVTGNSKDDFTAVQKDSSGYCSLYVQSSAGFIKQSNFPRDYAGIANGNISVSSYAGGEFYMYLNYRTRKFIHPIRP